MTCEELRPDYLLYALGVLEEPEHSEVRAHLGRGCETCAAGMREARALACAVGTAPEGANPPRRLRNRILAAAGGPARRWDWLTAAVAAGSIAAAAAGLLLYQASGFRVELAQARVEIERSRADAALLRQAIDLLQAPDTREVDFGPSPSSPPRGRVFLHSSGVLLVASQLPPSPPGMVYEMWIIRGGNPAPAGVFTANAQGNAFNFYRPPAPPAKSDIIAVTIEPAGGVAKPTSAPILAATL